MTDIIVAVIAFGGSVLGTFGGIIIASNLTNYRIEQLEKKVEKHNKLIERTYKLEEHDTLLDEKIKVVNHRLEDLEELIVKK